MTITPTQCSLIQLTEEFVTTYSGIRRNLLTDLVRRGGMCQIPAAHETLLRSRQSLGLSYVLQS